MDIQENTNLNVNDWNAKDFWKMIVDENHPGHKDAVNQLAEALSKPLRCKIRGSKSNEVICDDRQDG